MADPKGVVGVLIDEAGYVWAEASDFNASGSGGFDLERSQQMRVENRLAIEFMRSACAPPVLKAIDDYDCRKIVENLIRNHKWKRKLISIGHEEPAQ